MRNNTLIGAAILLVLLAATNPTQADFTDWIKGKVNQKVKNNGLRVLGNLLAEPLVAATTTRTNLLFCSVFTAHLSEEDQRHTLGILTFFIPLDGKPQE